MILPSINETLAIGDLSKGEGQHYVAYDVIERTSINQTVVITDALGTREVTLTAPEFFAVPVEKNHAGTSSRIIDDRVHLAIYRMQQTVSVDVTVDMGDQSIQDHLFGQQGPTPASDAHASKKLDAVVGTVRPELRKIGASETFDRQLAQGGVGSDRALGIGCRNGRHHENRGEATPHLGEVATKPLGDSRRDLGGGIVDLNPIDVLVGQLQKATDLTCG